jgi:hypothetical protein
LKYGNRSQLWHRINPQHSGAENEKIISEEQKMRRSSGRYSLSCASFAALFLFASTGFAADTHTIVAHSNLTWSYNGKSSTAANPIMVDDLKTGDIVEVQVPGGTHGFITIKKNAGGAPPTEITDPVLACGEAEDSKPNAVLREIECGATSNFNKLFVGSLKLEVLPKFTGPIDFYCKQHRAAMPGTLKLKAGP